MIVAISQLEEQIQLKNNVQIKNNGSSMAKDQMALMLWQDMTTLGLQWHIPFKGRTESYLVCKLCIAETTVLELGGGGLAWFDMFQFFLYPLEVD